MNCKSELKTWDFFFAWYSLDITSKSLGCSLELRGLYLNFNQTSNAILRYNHVNIILIPELWNESVLKLSMKSFFASLRQHCQHIRDRNTKFRNKELLLGKKQFHYSVECLAYWFLLPPFSRTTWIFTLTWHFHHNQSSSVPVGGNPDLSEPIFPDDIPVPTTVDLYLNICCRKYTIQYRSGIRTALFNAYDLTVKRVLIVLYVQHGQALLVFTATEISCSLTEKFRESLFATMKSAL